MPYITLRPDLYGITSLLDFRKETADPLCALTQSLLRGTSSLTTAEREMIAAYVSSLNACIFCSNAHTSAACLLPGGKETGIQPLNTELDTLKVTAKMHSLLMIAGQVQQGGRNVTSTAIQSAKEKGATDLEIHDTVLIAALFCLYNRYVDGLGTQRPDDLSFYHKLGERITTRGYKMPEDGYHALSVKNN